MQQHGRDTTAETLQTESLEYWGSFVVYNAGTGTLNTLEGEVLGGFEDQTGKCWSMEWVPEPELCELAQQAPSHRH